MTKDKPRAVVVTGASAGRAAVRAFARQDRRAGRERSAATGAGPFFAARRRTADAEARA